MPNASSLRKELMSRFSLFPILAMLILFSCCSGEVSADAIDYGIGELDNSFIDIVGEEQLSGLTIKAAGDVNGDGCDDLAIMPEKTDLYDVPAIVYGWQGQWAADTDLIEKSIITIDEIELDEDYNWREVDWDVVPLGDVNNDGFGDIAVLGSTSGYMPGYDSVRSMNKQIMIFGADSYAFSESDVITFSPSGSFSDIVFSESPGDFNGDEIGMVLHWNDSVIEIPLDTMKRYRHSEKYSFVRRGTKDEPMSISLKVDFVVGKFVIKLKNTAIADSEEPIDFRMQFGEFDQSIVLE